MLFSLILDVNMKEKTSISTFFMSHFVKLRGGSNNIQLRNVSFCQIAGGVNKGRSHFVKFKRALLKSMVVSSDENRVPVPLLWEV